MRLLTHNLLCCVKCQHYPLDVRATDIAPAEAPFDADFVRRMLNRVTYAYLVDAFESLHSHPALQSVASLPPTLEEVDLSDESTQLRDIHFALNAFAVRNGALTCSKCETTFPINEFIPNMLVE
ncbi:Hypothetical protein, putative [Bodo saltans]|uniref:Trm112p-like protein n=1 Tax=Bodo saltans TaxID=75058 RepID=A0A0S4J2Y9_BODSA|nr:Hypothetical protein, putative [Bodo saltans]|eukprot:CUG62097.1 Hypothetical protein, putative [Bodo saltans]